ncbi:hypothetical protein K2173_027198 [Erythroxylum novogranatense]|uniref:Aspartic peptidase DDI1-type domain-containing protein n=1 Tax=Erythroxylum novogranatense TaxID=1862640 RepID=A0AAV8TZR7_9ROSI|nr:hypothetical protein K2173_027198 [Erythroxylum novogranatense]
MLAANTERFQQDTRLAQSKKKKEDNSIMELFQKVEVNIPLLEAIKQVPRYVKFLKELCTNKRKLTGNERAMCDLGASINVMPLSVYTSLGLGPLISTGVIIQLTNRSIVYSEGVLEDVLVQSKHGSVSKITLSTSSQGYLHHCYDEIINDIIIEYPCDDLMAGHQCTYYH